MTISWIRLIAVVFIFLTVLVLPTNSDGYRGPWISISGTLNHFSLTDFDRELEEAPTQDISLGASLGFDLRERWATGLNYDFFLPNRNSMLEMSASLLTAELAYLHPLSSALRLGAGGEVGLIYISGLTRGRFAFPEPFFINGVKGKNLVLKAFTIAQWHCTSSIAITSKAGYRFSRIDKLESDSGNSIIATDGHPVAADYSGWFLGLGLRLYP